ncbi:Protein of unknown function [Cotesia congregata]|uniref:Uncharacterized protein n=1 Tax=Cotesia congregata TaxID=51543 RepID=A0A8J2H6U0_COTCN|nr:Protein of unknown function [Cotesia congregata]
MTPKLIHLNSEIEDPDAAARNPLAKRRRSLQQYAKNEQPMACHIQGELNTLQHLYESLMSDSNKDQLKDGKNNKYKLSVGYEKFTFITNNISKSAENFYIYDADFLEETSLIINKIFMDATFRSFIRSRNTCYICTSVDACTRGMVGEEWSKLSFGISKLPGERTIMEAQESTELVIYIINLKIFIENPFLS